MNIGEVTVQVLFNGAVQYVVPSFQRRYVWEQDMQWAPLWKDLTTKATSLLTDGPDNVNSHFLGSILLKQQDPTPGQPIPHLVVDGQQRLTTLQIMIIAISDALKEMSRDEDVMCPYIVNPFASGDNKYKLRPFAERDFTVFKQLADSQQVSNEKHVLVLCHQYFKAQAISWLDGDSASERSRALVKAISDVMVVGLNLGTDDDEYVIFESLNARGAPLTEWDKSKNYLLAKSRDTQMGEHAFYLHFIAQFDDSEWWNQVIHLPRFEGSRIELLLNYWLTIKLNRGIQASSLWQKSLRRRGD